MNSWMSTTLFKRFWFFNFSGLTWPIVYLKAPVHSQYYDTTEFLIILHCWQTRSCIWY